MLYSPFKKNKYSGFFKTYDTSDRENSEISKQRLQGWDYKLRNPSHNQEVDIFGDSISFSDKSDEVPNLGKN